MLEAARRLTEIGLLDAPAMVVVVAETGDARFERWSARWLERVSRERQLQPDTKRTVERLMRALPRQNEARAVELALASYAAPRRTWS